jgi:chromosome segregation ATPase
MFAELPQNLMLMTVGAFVLGWILASISARLGSKYRSSRRDPRDDRIRSLEAELRVKQASTDKLRETTENLSKDLEEYAQGSEKRDNVISHQQEKIEGLKKDLMDSVKKTRELRHELSDRATESVRSEAKLREVETELSVAQASTDMIATGVLDYSLAPETDYALATEDNDSSSRSRKAPDLDKTGN